MGWTGIPCESRPTNQELNQLLKHELETSTCRIIDRSSWLDHGKHQFLLMESTPADGTNPLKFVLMVMVDYRQHQLLYKDVEESMGPTELDCPMRIMKQLEGQPDLGPYSKAWRQNVLEYHAQNKLTTAIVKKLQQNYPEGDKRLVLNGGAQVNFRMETYRGRAMPVYHRPGTHTFHVLRSRMIDPQATGALWSAEPADTPAAPQRA